MSDETEKIRRLYAIAGTSYPHYPGVEEDLRIAEKAARLICRPSLDLVEAVESGNPDRVQRMLARWRALVAAWVPDRDGEVLSFDGDDNMAAALHAALTQPYTVTIVSEVPDDHIRTVTEIHASRALTEEEEETLTTYYLHRYPELSAATEGDGT